jgi:alpha-glucosidase
MIAKLLRQGFKTIPIVDPGVKDDPHFGVCQRGIAANAFVKAADGKADVLGEAWPGVCRFPDFLNPAARLWWGQEQSALHTLGVAGYWTDMNEPANFARPDKTLPPDALHHTDHGVKPHSEVHNLYGFEMARATRDGALKDAPNERPFVVTRAGWAGIQRHALVWTGDNSSHWDHLADSIQMLMNLSLSGVAFCGADVGGFRGNATPELFARWFQMAALTPFFRNHSDIGTVDQEPWAFGEEVEGICRHYLQLRYRLMPYLYGLFAEAHRTGAPIMRPLLWHYQNDPVASACGDEFLLGRNILVAPMIRPGAVARSVYLPNDMWCDFWTGEMHQGGRHITVEAPLDTLPLFVRAGALIPMMEVQQYVGERPIESMELHCWPGSRDELEWYEDDGVTQRYEQGDFCRRTISAQTFKRTLTLDFGEERGSYLTPIKTWRLAIWGATRKAALKVNGVSIQGAFDPATGLFAADLPNTPGKVTLQFAGV